MLLSHALPTNGEKTIVKLLSSDFKEVIELKLSRFLQSWKKRQSQTELEKQGIWKDLFWDISVRIGIMSGKKWAIKERTLARVSTLGFGRMWNCVKCADEIAGNEGELQKSE